MSVPEPLPVMYVDCSPFPGGAQRSFADLITAVRGHGVQPYLIGGDPSCDGLAAACARDGVETSAVRSHHWRRSLSGLLFYALDRWRWRGRLAACAAAWRPRLVHVNGVRSGLLVSGRLPRGVPLVLHDRDVRGPQEALRRLSREVSHVIAISGFVGRRWSALLEPERVSTIWNGFDVEGMAAVSPSGPWPGPGSGTRFVLVADLVEWKGHALFLDALARVRGTAREAVCGLVVGRSRDPSGAAYLAELRLRARALGLDEAVGFVTDASDALPLIAAADVVVSAARGEPFGRTVVEGLALGRPVVAVRGGGPDEILEPCRAGTLVDADAEALAAGLCRWLDPQKRDAAAAAARERARTFDLNSSAARVAALYQDLLRRGKRTAAAGRDSFRSEAQHD